MAKETRVLGTTYNPNLKPGAIIAFASFSWEKKKESLEVIRVVSVYHDYAHHLHTTMHVESMGFWFTLGYRWGEFCRKLKFKLKYGRKYDNR